MTTLIDIGTSPHFAASNLTRAVNVVPNKYGRLNELGLFPIVPVDTTYVEVEYRNNSLNLLPSQERGAPGTQSVRGDRNKRVFNIPHIPHLIGLKASDLQNKIKFGTTNVLEKLQDAYNDELIAAANKHFITLEHLRMGAMKGLVLDADGSTLLDLWTEFGITQLEVHFDLSNAAADVNGSLLTVKRHIEDNLLGEQMTYIRALCSEEWFDDFISHPKIEKAYENYASKQEPLREDVRHAFYHKGIWFEEYRGNASYLENDGTMMTRRFIDAGDVHFMPMGTSATMTASAPPDVLSQVNRKPKDLIFVGKPERLKHDKGIEANTESNPLPLCTRPALLVKGDADAP